MYILLYVCVYDMLCYALFIINFLIKNIIEFLLFILFHSEYLYICHIRLTLLNQYYIITIVIITLITNLYIHFF